MKNPRLGCSTCPACGETRHTPDETLGIWAWEGICAGFNRCTRCLSSYSNTEFTADQIAKWYSERFPYVYYSDPIHYLNATNRIKFLVKRQWLPEADHVVLDIGCAAGLFLGALKQQVPAASYAGVEFLPEVAAKFSGKLGFPIVTINEIGANTADMVFMWHVLEHSLEPQVQLSAALRLCKSGARLAIACPNRHALGFTKRGAQWVWCQAPWIHCVHFTANGLAELLRRNGLSDFAFYYRETVDAFHMGFLNRPDWYPVRGGRLQPTEERPLEASETRYASPLHSCRFWHHGNSLRRIAIGTALSQIITPRHERSELICLVQVP